MDRSMPAAETRGWLLRLFPAFSSYNFRWLLAANAAASLGMSMEMLAQGWLVLTLTDSAFWVGAVAGLRGAGLVAFGAMGGVIVDRVDRRKALALAQMLRGAAVLTLGLLVVTEQVTLPAILAIALFQGVMQGIVLPANNTLVYDTTGPSRILNAVSARMMAFNVARIGGSMLAGTLISSVGVGWCYVALSGAFFLSPALLLLMRGSFQGTGGREPVWRTLKEGVRYAMGARPLGSLLLLSLLMEMFGFSYHVMLPVMAREILHVGAEGLGLLAAAGGAGALLSTLTVASLGDFRRMGALMAVTAGGAGVSLFLFALSPWFIISAFLAALVGGSLMAYDATMASLLNLLSSDAMRGRVMGLYGLTFGFTPVGGFIAGVVATAINAPFAVGLGGTVITLWVLRLQGTLRRITRGSSVGGTRQVPGDGGGGGEAAEGPNPIDLPGHEP